MDDKEEQIEQLPTQPISMWQKIWSWGFVGAVSLFLLAGGISFMLSSHVWVADGFFIVGMLLLLVKFWTWEDTQQQSPKSQIALLVTATICSLGLLVGVCMWNHHINPLQSSGGPLPPNTAGGSSTIPPGSSGTSVVAEAPAGTVKTAGTASMKIKVVRAAEKPKQTPQLASSPAPELQNPQSTTPTETTPPAQTPTQTPMVGCIGGTGNACVGNNQPGGVVIGTLGYVPPADRVLLANDEQSAIELLKTVPPGNINILTLNPFRMNILGRLKTIKPFRLNSLRTT
jgi:hypothetical protein